MYHVMSVLSQNNMIGRLISVDYKGTGPGEHIFGDCAANYNRTGKQAGAELRMDFIITG